MFILAISVEYVISLKNLNPFFGALCLMSGASAHSFAIPRESIPMIFVIKWSFFLVCLLLFLSILLFDGFLVRFSRMEIQFPIFESFIRQFNRLGFVSLTLKVSLLQCKGILWLMKFQIKPGMTQHFWNKRSFVMIYCEKLFDKILSLLWDAKELMKKLLSMKSTFSVGRIEYYMTYWSS